MGIGYRNYDYDRNISRIRKRRSTIAARANEKNLKKKAARNTTATFQMARQRRKINQTTELITVPIFKGDNTNKV